MKIFRLFQKIMSVIEIETELKRMNNAERLYVIEIGSKFLKADIAEKSDVKGILRQSGEIMREEYLENSALIFLNELDGEAFHDV